MSKDLSPKQMITFGLIFYLVPRTGLLTFFLGFNVGTALEGVSELAGLILIIAWIITVIKKKIKKQ